MAQYLYGTYSLDEAFGQGDESPGTGIADHNWCEPHVGLLSRALQNAGPESARLCRKGHRLPCL
jgi:hypothetical protein